VRAAHRGKSHAEEWLLIEWPAGDKEPTKYWLSTLPRDISFERLVDLAKLRWRIEHDYQELKQELGLGHFEGRSWRGFHHHATPCIAAYGFLISERETIPPRHRASSRHSRFPPITDPEAPPLRTEWHLPDSIATMRRRRSDAVRIAGFDIHRTFSRGSTASLGPQPRRANLTARQVGQRSTQQLSKTSLYSGMFAAAAAYYTNRSTHQAATLESASGPSPHFFQARAPAHR
jgi:hypothetical protein